MSDVANKTFVSGTPFKMFGSTFFLVLGVEKNSKFVFQAQLAVVQWIGHTNKVSNCHSRSSLVPADFMNYSDSDCPFETYRQSVEKLREL